MRGANHKVSFENADKVVVSGSANKVSGGTSHHLVVEVANNNIQSSLKPSGDGPSTLDVSGAENLVAVKIGGPTDIEVAGSAQTVTWTGSEGVKPPKVNMSGVKNSVKQAK